MNKTEFIISSVTVQGRKYDMTYTNVTLMAKNSNNQLVGSWKSDRFSLYTDAFTSVISIQNKDPNKLVAVLHLDHDVVRNLRVE